MSESFIIDFFSQYAYEPYLVYGFIIAFMTASSFGLPIPEEMTLISAGLVAYMANNPAQFPPPSADAVGVNLTILCLVCFFAVLGSDVLIYFIGKFFGQKIIKSRFFNKQIGQERYKKINNIFHKYSFWACGLFRFTPGIRFPGHLTCGALGFPLWKFLAVDGTAALVSVPTQVLLVANYGEVILKKIQEFKMYLAITIGVVVLFWLAKKVTHFFKTRSVNRS